MTAFLPIVEEYQVQEVLLIGHGGTDPLPKELWEVYLAVAGLAGTACERLHSEQELNRHRDISRNWSRSGRPSWRRPSGRTS